MLTLATCAPHPPREVRRHWDVTVTTQPAFAAASEPASEGPPPISLHGALAAPAAPQAFSIELHSRLAVDDPTGAAPAEVFTLLLDGTLSPLTTPTEPQFNVAMKLEQIRAHLRRSDAAGNVQTFEFPNTSAQGPDALSRVLGPLTHATLRLVVTPAGRLRQLRGVTALTRTTRRGLPASLHSFQTLLTDVAFERIVADALFPPLPSRPVHTGDSWQLSTPGSALDHCPTTTLLSGHIGKVADDAQSLPVIAIDAQGPIVALRECSSQEHLVEGREQRRQTLSWNDRSLRQHIERRLVIQLDPRPPAPPATAPAAAPAPVRRIREETLLSTRAGAATAAPTD